MKTLPIILVLVYNLILIMGTVYLIGWQSWDPWWFLLTVCLLNSYKSGDSK